MNSIVLQLLNLMPINIINCICTILTAYSCTHKNSNFKWLALSYVVKILLVNPINVYFITLYGESTWVQYLNLCSTVIAIILIFILYRMLFNLPYEKISIILILVDIRSLCCSFIPVFIISCLFHYNIMEHIQEPPNLYNFFIIPLAVIIALITQKLGNNLWNYIKEKNIKYPLFWDCIYIAYAGWGILTSCGHLNLLYPYKLIAFFLIITFFLVFWIKKKKTQLLELNNHYLLLQREMILQYYESLTEQINLTRKMKHDIDNHMQIIKRIQRENHIEALDSYTEDLKEQYDHLDFQYYCDNVIINALIVNKSKKCKKENIRFQTNLDNIQLGCISEYDFVSILFNLLDNAIESCVKMTEKQSCFINLDCFTDKGQLVIHSENSCNEKLPESKHLFFTTKPDKKQHGMGMHIIREAIQKYNGSIEIIQHSTYLEITIFLAACSFPH